MSELARPVAGLDVGTEFVKAIVLAGDGAILGRASVPTRGYFQERAREALDAALDDAQTAEDELGGLCATGFGASLVHGATRTASEAACHARGAFHHIPGVMTVVNIGGQEPRVIRVDGSGQPTEIASLRHCAVGIGTFLMFAARHLDVHPTQLQELAAGAEQPAHVGSYCSVFAGVELLERLREGASREEVALGCIHSVAERVAEIIRFEAPIRVTGGVAEFFPGVLKRLSGLTGQTVEAIPEPMLAGALGAALKARDLASRAGSTPGAVVGTQAATAKPKEQG